MYVKCKYCGSDMSFNDSFREFGGNYRLFICNNTKCRSVFEECADDKGKRLYDKDRWFQPTD